MRGAKGEGDEVGIRGQGQGKERDAVAGASLGTSEFAAHRWMIPCIALQCGDMFQERKRKRSSSHIKYALHALAKTPDLIWI